jgi:hypothetical protein
VSVRAIFGLQVLMSFVGYILIARFYAAPRLSALPLRVALIPLLLLHAFRHLVGTLDLINAFYQGMRNNVQLGAAYFISTFMVPALFVTHAMIFAMLTRRAR